MCFSFYFRHFFDAKPLTIRFGSDEIQQSTGSEFGGDEIQQSTGALLFLFFFFEGKRS